MKRSLIPILMSLCFASCSIDREEIAFCEIESGRLVPSPTRFNFEEQVILGSDVTYRLEIVETEFVRGIVSPFPMVLPKDLSSSRLPERWELEGYEFTVTNSSSEDPGWILINARPIELENKKLTIERTSVLYSFSRGVLALRWSSEYNDEVVAGEVFFCGTGRFDVTTF